MKFSFIHACLAAADGVLREPLSSLIVGSFVELLEVCINLLL
jgi:hypothetical protein